MAKNVNEAFSVFMSNTIRLNKNRSDVAKVSKLNLINEITKFSNDGKFPLLHPDISIDYGSFSRKTKIRPLDDIDLMIILHAQGSTHFEFADRIDITINSNADTLKDLCNENTYTLNSRKIINKFKEYLSKVSSYEMAEIKRNQEAVTLKLSSYEWVYDIVPSFMANMGNGITLYLIPDGNGSWKKSDPTIDLTRTNSINSAQTVSVLDVIRIFKYWTKRPTMPTMRSYFLENLILNYYNSGNLSQSWLDIEIPKLLYYIHEKIHFVLDDPKGFQGNINHLTYEEKVKISNKSAEDYNKAIVARQLEIEGKQKESIEKWKEIFGFEFPSYL